MFDHSPKNSVGNLRSTVRPNGVTAQAGELDISLPQAPSNTAKSGPPPLTMTLTPQLFFCPHPILAPARPYRDQAHDRRSDADQAQNVVRRRQRTLHGPAHPGRACREQQAFKHKQNAHTDEEVGERYGPHRIETSRLIFLDFRRDEAIFASPPVLCCLTASARPQPSAPPAACRTSC